MRQGNPWCSMGMSAESARRVAPDANRIKTKLRRSWTVFRIDAHQASWFDESEFDFLRVGLDDPRPLASLQSAG